MKILSVNAGSSSLKFQMYEMDDESVLISGVFERIGINNSFYTIKINGEKIKKEVELQTHKDAVKILVDELFENNVISDLSEIKGIGHRVVQGSDKYKDSVIIDEDVIKAIEEFSILAPLHNPAAIIGINAFKEIVPNAVAVAVFDTSFHQTMEIDKYLYAVPYSWYEDYNVRKYGAHGTSHKYIANRISEILDRKDLKVISCHIGNGASITAIKDGKCVDTSMGFTPTVGLIMGSRCGDIDATILPYIAKQANLTLEEVEKALNKESGLLGISGVSSDSRDIEDGIKEGNERCILAQNMYINKIVDYIAKYYVLLNGVDAICFTAGVGENSIGLRKTVLEKLEVLGIKVDAERNNIRSKEALITSDDSSVACYVIPTDEEVMIARDTYNLIK